MNRLLDKVTRLLSDKGARFEARDEDLLVDIPEEQFIPALTALVQDGFELASLFAIEGFRQKKGFTLLYLMEKKKHQPWLMLQRNVHDSRSGSVASLLPSACWYEREIKDGFGIVFDDAQDQRPLFLHEPYPAGFHPLLKSFENRKIPAQKIIPEKALYQFKKVDGEEVYQIPVGPVHAGIIEPGHFRFSVIGETICNLEIRMFYMHRGVEKLAFGRTPQDVVAIAESISGDETMANAVGFCSAVEKISGKVPPQRAQFLRTLFLEMERMYSLLGDLAGMIIDVAYPVGATPFFVLREELLRQNQALTGSRFMKNAVCIGGVRNDVSESALKGLKKYLSSFAPCLQDAVAHIRKTPSVIDRFDTTGIIRKDLVKPLHLTGPAARASGVNIDTRIDHPYGLYAEYAPRIKVLDEGDVLARFELKFAEVIDSSNICQKIIASIPKGEVHVQTSIKDGFSVSVVESARGQNVHFIYIENGKLARYKVRTASFCNWQAIEHAVMGNIVPDFPLINKSLNLSYAGTDL